MRCDYGLMWDQAEAWAEGLPATYEAAERVVAHRVVLEELDPDPVDGCRGIEVWLRVAAASEAEARAVVDALPWDVLDNGREHGWTSSGWGADGPFVAVEPEGALVPAELAERLRGTPPVPDDQRAALIAVAVASDAAAWLETSHLALARAALDAAITGCTTEELAAAALRDEDEVARLLDAAQQRWGA